MDEDGLWYILGRSDDTIKVAGKRLGPAEIELIWLPTRQWSKRRLSASLINQRQRRGCLLVLAESCGVCEELRQELTEYLINHLGKALAPKAIYSVTDLPKTRNGKVMRRMIRAAYLGEDPGDTDPHW